MSQSQLDVRLGWPEVAVVPVTYLCNAHCDMCALGDLRQRERLSDDALVDIFSDPSVSATLRAINFTGGEPTLRKDLPDLVAKLVDVCPRLESLSLNSNGMLRTSAQTILKVLDVAKSRGKKLYLFISLDGVGQLHDEIRGVRGAFAAVCRTLDTIQALGTSRSQLGLGVSATATRKNIDHLDDVLRFAVERELMVSFTFPMSTDVYMNNLDRLDRFESDRDLVDRFTAFLDTLERYLAHVSPPLSFYRSLQATLRGELRQAPCIFQRGGFFLEPNGNVLPCWRSSELKFGSVLEQPFPEIWAGPRRRGIIATIREKFCDSCPSPCYVGFPSPLLEAPTGGADVVGGTPTSNLGTAISVVIICRDEAGYVDGRLASLHDTVGRARRWRADPVIGPVLSIVLTDRAGYSYQRNVGVGAAWHPWVIARTRPGVIDCFGWRAASRRVAVTTVVAACLSVIGALAGWFWVVVGLLGAGRFAGGIRRAPDPVASAARAVDGAGRQEPVGV